MKINKKNKIIVSVDPGLSGGIAIMDEKIKGIDMPTIKVEVSPKKEIFDLLNNKKQYIKSGPNKGKPKMKIKKPAKFKKDIDIKKIYEIFNMADIIVIEMQGARPGCSAMSSALTMKNYGKLLAAATIANKELFIVSPNLWKKYFNLTLSKEEKIKLTNSEYKKLSIKKIKKLYDYETKKDGIADAILIGKYYIEKELSNTKKKDEINR
jgi:hypothetical protein